MRSCINPPLSVRGAEFGGPKPLFCIPLVAAGRKDLLEQARIALALNPDVIEWRSDAFTDDSATSMLAAAAELRSLLPHLPIIFTLRSAKEGGANKVISQQARRHCLETVLPAGLVDLIDLELHNETEFLDGVVEKAHLCGVRVILSFHDFQTTPPDETLHTTVDAMVAAKADIAKLACMPREADDALRLLQVTVALRKRFPALPLCITSMGKLGAISRVAGFLYGSDMAFAVGQQASAPGQIPLQEARAMTALLLRASGGMDVS